MEGVQVNAFRVFKDKAQAGLGDVFVGGVDHGFKALYDFLVDGVCGKAVHFSAEPGKVGVFFLFSGSRQFSLFIFFPLRIACHKIPRKNIVDVKISPASVNTIFKKMEHYPRAAGDLLSSIIMSYLPTYKTGSINNCIY